MLVSALLLSHLGLNNAALLHPGNHDKTQSPPVCADLAGIWVSKCPRLAESVLKIEQEKCAQISIGPVDRTDLTGLVFSTNDVEKTEVNPGIKSRQQSQLVWIEKSGAKISEVVEHKHLDSMNLYRLDSEILISKTSDNTLSYKVTGHLFSRQGDVTINDKLALVQCEFQRIEL